MLAVAVRQAGLQQHIMQALRPHTQIVITTAQLTQAAQEVVLLPVADS